MNSNPLLQDQEQQKFLYNNDIEYVATLRTDWIDKSCCCFRIAYFPVGDFSICEHWRMNFKKPILISIFMLASLVFFFLDTSSSISWGHSFPTDTLMKTSYSLISVVFFFVALSYFLIIFIGPGYMPYNWCISKQNEYDFETMMSSIAVYNEQMLYGQTHERPERSSFSTDARRFVMRADHFCWWTESWIGLKNQRYFILLTFWFSVYCLLYIGFRYFWAYDIIKTCIDENKFDFTSLPGWIFVVAFMGLFVFSIRLFLVSIVNLSKNITLIEKWKSQKAQKPIVSYTPGRKTLDNCQDVCGPKECLLLWPFPFICFRPVPPSWDIEPETNLSTYTESINQFTSYPV